MSDVPAQDRSRKPIVEQPSDAVDNVFHEGKVTLADVQPPLPLGSATWGLAGATGWRSSSVEHTPGGQARIRGSGAGAGSIFAFDKVGSSLSQSQFAAGQEQVQG